MKAELFFELKMKYTVTMYKPLKELAVHEFYDSESKRYIWIFRVKDIKEVLAIAGTEIEFNREEMVQLIKRCPYITEQVKSDKYKGKGMLEVTDFPNLFLVETIIRKKKQTFRIPRETVNKMWEVVKKQPLLKKVRTRTVAENFCNLLGITRFNRGETIYEENGTRIQSTKKGSFDFAKLFGERDDYFKCYYSLKVLQYYGVIEYHTWGAIEKLSDDWEMQEQIHEPLVKG